MIVKTFPAITQELCMIMEWRPVEGLHDHGAGGDPAIGAPRAALTA
jgi:hypothetical protein